MSNTGRSYIFCFDIPQELIRVTARPAGENDTGGKELCPVPSGASGQDYARP